MLQMPKRQLRKLFRLVHPDLFHNNEICRRVNEKSFQTLMQFLDDMERPFRQTIHDTFSLRFFYRNEDGELKEAAIRFEPPPGLVSGKERERYAFICIQRLLRAMGVQELDGGKGDAGEETLGDEPLVQDLFQFLKDNIALCRQREAAYEIRKQDFDMLEKSVEDTLEVRIYISVLVDQADALSGLKRMMEYSRELKKCKLSGLRLVMGSRYELRTDGALCIPYDFRIEDALKFMHEHEKDARKRSQTSKVQSYQMGVLCKRLKNELDLARLDLNFECDDKDVVRGLYNLENCRENILNHDLHDLTILIGNGFRVSAGGNLVIPFEFQCAELNSFLNANVAKARACTEKLDEVERKILCREKQFRDKLAVYIRRNIWISDEEYVDCLDRMIQAAGVFDAFDVKGRWFSVGEEFAVLDTGTIQIKHNFTFQELTTFGLEHRFGQDCRCDFSRTSSTGPVRLKSHLQRAIVGAGWPKR